LISHFPIDTGRLAYIHRKKAKNAPTLIFLHNSLGCIETWRDFPELLAENSKCNYLVYDRLGHGQSPRNSYPLKKKKDYLVKEADVLSQLIVELEITDPILYGHSDGGSIALIAASKNKSTIKGIIVEPPYNLTKKSTTTIIEKLQSKKSME